MITIKDLTEACKKMRLSKRAHRFRPHLIYLVDTITGYTHPRRLGYTSGQTAWADKTLWFQCHKDAAEHAAAQPAWHKAKVVKLNIAAFEEPVIRSTDPVEEPEEAEAA